MRHKWVVISHSPISGDIATVFNTLEEAKAEYKAEAYKHGYGVILTQVITMRGDIS